MGEGGTKPGGYNKGIAVTSICHPAKITASSQERDSSTLSNESAVQRERYAYPVLDQYTIVVVNLISGNM